MVPSYLQVPVLQLFQVDPLVLVVHLVLAIPHRPMDQVVLADRSHHSVPEVLGYRQVLQDQLVPELQQDH